MLRGLHRNRGYFQKSNDCFSLKKPSWWPEMVGETLTGRRRNPLREVNRICGIWYWLHCCKAGSTTGEQNVVKDNLNFTQIPTSSNNTWQSKHTHRTQRKRGTTSDLDLDLDWQQVQVSEIILSGFGGVDLHWAKLIQVWRWCRCHGFDLPPSCLGAFRYSCEQCRWKADVFKNKIVDKTNKEGQEEVCTSINNVDSMGLHFSQRSWGSYLSGLRTGKHDSAAESSGQSHSGQGQESALQSHLLHRWTCFKQMKHSKHMSDKMMRIFFFLVCGALAAAQESNQILHPAANRFGNHRANQQVQRPAGTQQTKWWSFISLEVKYVFLYITNKYNLNLLIWSTMRSNQSSEQ